MTDAVDRLIAEVKDEMEPDYGRLDSLRVEFLGWDPEDGAWKFPSSTEYDDE